MVCAPSVSHICSYNASRTEPSEMPSGNCQTVVLHSGPVYYCTKENRMRRFTNSETTTWRRCRRMWWLKYWRKLAPKVEHFNVNREIGNVVHDVLAWGYENDWNIEIDASVAYVVYAMRENGHSDEDDPCQICEKNAQEIHEYSKLMVEGYKKWLEEEGADSDFELLAAETPVEVELEHLPGISLLGKIDAKFRKISDDSTLFTDHKTVQNLADLPKTAHLNTQFKHYHLLERATSLARTDGLIANMLRRVKRTSRAKPPFYGRHEVRHNDAELRMYWYQVLQQIEEIMEAESRLASFDKGEMTPDFQVLAYMYPNPTADCSWDCEFFAVCPMFDRDEDAEDFLATSYVEIDPLVRYS